MPRGGTNVGLAIVGIGVAATVGVMVEKTIGVGVLLPVAVGRGVGEAVGCTWGLDRCTNGKKTVCPALLCESDILLHRLRASVHVRIRPFLVVCESDRKNFLIVQIRQ